MSVLEISGIIMSRVRRLCGIATSPSHFRKQAPKPLEIVTHANIRGSVKLVPPQLQRWLSHMFLLKNCLTPNLGGLLKIAKC